MPTKRTPKAPPPKSVSEVVVDELKRLRDSKGWSQERLADALQDLGASFDRSTIAKIETGFRKVSLEDCIALAIALDVPPSALFLPREAAEVELAPEVVVSAYVAAKWAKGVRPLRDSDPFDLIDGRFFYEHVTDVEWMGRRNAPVARFESLVSLLEKAAADRDWDFAESCLKGIQMVVKSGLEQINTEREVSDGQH